MLELISMKSNENSRFKQMLWFGFGFLVCFALMKLFDRTQKDNQFAEGSKLKNKSAQVKIESETKPKIQLRQDFAADKKPVQQSSNIKLEGEKISEAEFEKQPDIKREPSNDPPPTRQFEISISESDVIRMESTLDHLKEEVTISRESRGWRIKNIAQNSNFAQFGFQPGMLVLQEHIDAMARNGEGLNLVSRITYIFDSLAE